MLRELVRWLVDHLRGERSVELAGLSNAQIDAILNERRNGGAP